jgi:SAM-dependent methyltransferase
MTAIKARSKTRQKPAFDKYFHYTHSVQSAEHDAELLWKMMRKVWIGPLPKAPVLQEDFCGTAALCYEWVRLGTNHQATGIDLDSNALAWGAQHHTSELSNKEISRVNLVHGDVMKDHGVKPHVICALNFSYFFIKDRSTLKQYFQACKRSLSKNGLLILDVFGGPEYLMPHSDQRRNHEQKFTYWWDVEMFDAITNQIKCHIHFKRDGEPQRRSVFTYDWRLWSIPEITDVLKESGFTKIEYWAEGLDRAGHGNGLFKPIKHETSCETWVTYIVAT